MIQLVCTIDKNCYKIIILRSFYSDTVAINDITNLNKIKELDSNELKYINLANKLRIFKNQYPEIWNSNTNSHSLREVDCPKNKHYNLCYFDLLDKSKKLKDFSNTVKILFNEEQNQKKLAFVI